MLKCNWSFTRLTGGGSSEWGWWRGEWYDSAECSPSCPQSPASNQSHCFDQTNVFWVLPSGVMRAPTSVGLQQDKSKSLLKKVKVVILCLNHAVQPEILPGHLIPVLLVRGRHPVTSSININTSETTVNWGPLVGTACTCKSVPGWQVSVLINELEPGDTAVDFSEPPT